MFLDNVISESQHIGPANQSKPTVYFWGRGLIEPGTQQLKKNENAVLKTKHENVTLHPMNTKSSKKRDQPPL